MEAKPFKIAVRHPRTESVSQRLISGTASVLLAVSICYHSALEAAPQALGSGLSIENRDRYARLTVADAGGLQPKLSVTSDKAVLTFSGVAPGNLGGEGVYPCRENRCLKVQVSKGSEVGSTQVTVFFKYPSGDLKPVRPMMDTFLSRDNEAGRIHLDFWMKPSESVQSKRISDEKARIAQTEVRIRQTTARLEKDRQEAFTLAEIQKDIARFCKLPIDPKVELGLPFQPIESRIPTDKLERRFPDDGYPYFLPQDTSDSSKARRFAQEMYEEQKYGLAEKSLQFFEKADSKRAKEIAADTELLRASIAFKLGKKELAFQQLQTLANKYRDHPAALRATQILIVHAFQSGRTQEAAELAIELGQRFPLSESRVDYLWIAAESYYQRNLSDRALEMYRTLKADPTASVDVKVFAQMRLGDSNLYRKQYDQALAEYTKLFTEYHNESSHLVAAKIHQAEALYQLGQTKVALEKFKQIHEVHSESPESWRAILRIAEIKARGLDAREREEARNYYKEVLNRFPYSSGAVLAKMALIPCGDHAGFNLSMAKDFFETDAANFDPKKIFWMDNYSKARGVARVRSLVILGGPELALEASFQERAFLPKSTESAQWLRYIERQLFRNLILESLSDKNVFNALLIYDKYVNRVDFKSRTLTSTNETILDPSYLRQLAESASIMGLELYAKKILANYRLQEALYQSLLAPEEKREEKTTFVDLMDLLKNSDSKTVSKVLNSVSMESISGQYEMYLVQAKVFEKDGKIDSALSSLESARMVLYPPNGQVTKAIQYELGLIENQKIDYFLKKKSYAVAYDLLMASEEVAIENSEFKALRNGLYVRLDYSPVPTLAVKLEKAASVMTEQNQWEKALIAYERLTKQDPKNPKALYMSGVTLERLKRNSEANTYFKKVTKTESPSFWKELAQRKIAGEQAAREGQSL